MALKNNRDIAAIDHHPQPRPKGEVEETVRMKMRRPSGDMKDTHCLGISCPLLSVKCLFKHKRWDPRNIVQ
ncbi:hypothetical protein KC19_3G182800 [Ceratodon purpureus]|uniref:Uncharacterized protein n=1 Tax=Ceratodon purpureus TaxID=3225 RepID=A0A8T0ILE8_CERPU|nr:hypothetical protein KC19_3G182800 [Ceratodon purpureus]